MFVNSSLVKKKAYSVATTFCVSTFCVKLDITVKEF